MSYDLQNQTVTTRCNLRVIPGGVTRDTPSPPSTYINMGRRGERKADWGDLPGGQYPMDGITLLPEHLHWMRRDGRADSTVRARRVAVVRLAEYLQRDPAQATYRELDSWQCTLPSLTELRRHTSLIRPYYAYLHAKGVRKDNPAVLLPLPKAPVRLPRPISEERLAYALASAPPRIYPWLLLAGWVGLRAAGIARLHVEDFERDAQGRMFARVIEKGNAERIVPIPEWLWHTISATFPDSGPCFRRVRGWGAGVLPVTAQHVSQYSCEYLHKVGLADTLHALRHRIATICMEESGDLRLVQTLLGHSDPASTALYTRVAPRRLAKLLDSVPPPVLLQQVRTA